MKVQKERIIHLTTSSFLSLSSLNSSHKAAYAAAAQTVAIQLSIITITSINVSAIYPPPICFRFSPLKCRPPTGIRRHRTR